MAKEIFMPKLSSTMSAGTLLQWFKEEGDTVEIGEPLFEIMTDKINIEVEAYDQGVLLKKYYQEDEEVPVNQIIGYIGETGKTFQLHHQVSPVVKRRSVNLRKRQYHQNKFNWLE